MKLRKLIIAVHRDVGYFFAGLTVIYAVSGVAVNHVEHWNPSYSVSHTRHEVGDLAGLEHDEMVRTVLRTLDIEETPRSAIRMTEDELRIFLNNRTLQVAVPAGHVLDERTTKRPGLFQVNYLHLNHGKGLWTWVADVYAVGLLVLALTGIFIITGKKGLGGRGRWLLLAGLLLPIVFLVLKA